jgi:hypothetical protein
MKRMRIMGLCLGALCAVGIFAASASAEPVFFGKAEIGGAVKAVPFSATSGVSFLEGHTSKLKVECKASTGTGEVSGPSSVAKSVTKFTGCEVAGLALPCENTAAKEITTESLSGELGAITSTVPGVRLKGESGIYLAQFVCAGGGVQIKAKGSVIGKMSGASGNTVEEGKLATTLTLSLEQTGGIQKYTHFLTGPSEQITSAVNEFNEKTGKFEEHEELSAQSQKVSLKTTPAGQIGLTK